MYQLELIQTNQLVTHNSKQYILCPFTMSDWIAAYDLLDHFLFQKKLNLAN